MSLVLQLMKPMVVLFMNLRISTGSLDVVLLTRGFLLALHVVPELDRGLYVTNFALCKLIHVPIWTQSYLQGPSGRQKNIKTYTMKMAGYKMNLSFSADRDYI